MLELNKIFSNINIKNTIPPYCKINKPTIIYKYNNPIRNKIFNYTHTINNLHTYNDFTCNCSESTFCNVDLGHIVTGNLDIVKNIKLKKLLTYGPQYRIPTKISWNDIYKEVIKSLNECTDKWHKKEHIDIKVLNEWKSSVIKQINKKIKKLKKHKYQYKYQYKDHDMIDILKDTHIKQELNNIHDKYVIVNADKASNNIIIICKNIIWNA